MSADYYTHTVADAARYERMHYSEREAPDFDLAEELRLEDERRRAGLVNP